MKKQSIIVFCLSALLATPFLFSNCSEDDLSLQERLDKLEESTINSVEGQKASINKTINYLKSLEPSLDAYSRQTVIALEDSLQFFVNNVLTDSVDWYSATVATLAQYENAVSKLALLGEYMSGLCAEYGDSVQALSTKIDNAITSMQGWVNATLTNYYDIAQVDAKLALLYSQMLASDSTHLADIVRLDLSMATLDSKYTCGIEDVDSKVFDTQKRLTQLDSTTTKNISLLHDQLDSAKVNLTKAYIEAINNAIETNNGVIDTKIANEIATVNTRIDNEINAINLKIASLEGRISALEERVNELSKQLGIRFSDNDISCSPGDVVTIDYTIINGTDSTTVYALSSNGYKVKIIPATKSTGSIKVTVPNPIEDCSILIFVNNADRTVLKSLNCISGTMSISADAVMVDADGDDVSVDLSTDLQYTVRVPEAATWVHYNNITTKSVMRNETINFTVDENVTPNPRSVIVELVNGSGLTIGSVTIRQSANVMQANEIWYTSTDKSIITPTNDNIFGANIISNVYGKSKGIITFDGDVKRIGYKAFMNSKIQTVSVPDKVTLIDESAFYGCNSLSTVIIPNSVQEIGSSAFFDCGSLSSISIPNSVTTIGLHAFEYTGLKSIILPSSITVINDWTFSRCKSLETVTFPDSLTTIGLYAFQSCPKLTNIKLPESLIELGAWAFQGCNSLDTIVIPSTVNSYMRETFINCSNLESVSMPPYARYDNTFAGCTKLKDVYVKYVPPVIDKDVFKNSSLDELTLYVPKGLKTMYENIDVFKDFGSIIEIDTLILKKPEAVDLGLSVKWASFNVGANTPTESGLYFAWGEIHPKQNYSWTTNRWSNGTYYSLTKYNTEESYGIVDNKTYLDLADDAAQYYLEGNWRIPTKEEFEELLNESNCTWIFTIQDGVKGYRVTSKIEDYTDKSIFLPAAGYRDIGNGVSGYGNFGLYWANSVYTSSPRLSYILYTDPTSHGVSYYERCEGRTIRAVCP